MHATQEKQRKEERRTGNTSNAFHLKSRIMENLLLQIVISMTCRIQFPRSDAVVNARKAHTL